MFYISFKNVAPKSLNMFACTPITLKNQLIKSYVHFHVSDYANFIYYAISDVKALTTPEYSSMSLGDLLSPCMQFVLWHFCFSCTIIFWGYKKESECFILPYRKTLHSKDAFLSDCYICTLQ